MIEARQIPELEKNIELLGNQMDMLEKRVRDSKHIEPKDNTPEEERTRILTIIGVQKGKLSLILGKVKSLIPENKSEQLPPGDLLENLQVIDSSISSIKATINIIAEEQYECKLGIYKQEIFKTLDMILDLFDFLIPNIRYEINLMEKFYRVPANAVNTILPELMELIEDLENQKITLGDFIKGYGNGKSRTPGYNDLRSRNRVFSKFQFYENPSETYKDINVCLYEARKAIEPFLSEFRSEPEFAKFFEQLQDGHQTIDRMSDIFETAAFFSSLIKKVGKKYSYRDEYKKTKSLVEKFRSLQKSLIVYNNGPIERMEKTLADQLQAEADKKKLRSVMEEVKKYIQEKTLSFHRLEAVFSKLKKKDFNIVIQEKEADDITINITPHHEAKFGKDILERINIIILEIDFWYPPETKQLLFQNLGKTTEKIQADEPVDKNEFFKLMQGYDKEMEKNVRVLYPDKIKMLNSIFAAYQKTVTQKLNREKLEQRLANKEIWNEVNPRLKNSNKSLLVLASGSPSLKAHVNKFAFIRIATEDLCQILYDLSMQLFILYPGVDNRSIANMTNILSTFNEFSDVASLWASFSHFFKKTTINNLSVNEQMMIALTKSRRCKTKLNALFPKGK